MQGKGKIKVNPGQSEQTDKLFGTGKNRGREQTIINDTNNSEKEEPIGPTTTIHIRRGTNTVVDSFYKLAGFKSKMEFADEAIKRLIKSEKIRLNKAGMDVDQVLSIINKSK